MRFCVVLTPRATENNEVKKKNESNRTISRGDQIPQSTIASIKFEKLRILVRFLVRVSFITRISVEPWVISWANRDISVQVQTNVTLGLLGACL